jgi:hypothetical protein
MAQFPFPATFSTVAPSQHLLAYAVKLALLVAEFVFLGDVADASVGVAFRQYLTAFLPEISVTGPLSIKITLKYILTMGEEFATTGAFVFAIFAGKAEGNESEE